MTYTTKEIGSLGERYAANYLRRHGYTVRERNWRFEKYEIDLIAASLFDVAFVEVKTRTCKKEELELIAPPKMAVRSAKQRFTRTAALRYLYEHPTKKRPRMDVIEVWLSPSENGKKPKPLRIHHIKAAY